MSDQLIQKEYRRKVKLINHYNKKYYNDNTSEITDAEYDLLKKEIIDLEKNNKFLVSKKSPTKVIGYKPSKNFKKISHKVPMLSLANAFSKEDLQNFEKKILNFLTLLIDSESKSISIDWDDEIIQGILVTKNNEIVHKEFS